MSCPACGDATKIISEIIPTTAGEKIISKEVCINPKTTGCIEMEV